MFGVSPPLSLSYLHYTDAKSVLLAQKNRQGAISEKEIVPCPLMRKTHTTWHGRMESNHLITVQSRAHKTVVLLPYVARLSGLSTIDEIPAFGTLVRSAITQSGLVGDRSWTSYPIRLLSTSVLHSTRQFLALMCPRRIGAADEA